MECENLPIQMIVYCNERGMLHPLRFQLRDRQNKTHTVHIKQVIDNRKIKDQTYDAIMYLCKAVVDQKICLFELEYRVDTQQWLLFRQIY